MGEEYVHIFPGKVNKIKAGEREGPSTMEYTWYKVETLRRDIVESISGDAIICFILLSQTQCVPGVKRGNKTKGNFQKNFQEASKKTDEILFKTKFISLSPDFHFYPSICS